MKARGGAPAATARTPLGRGFACLVGSQFLGAVNDHYVKILVSLQALERGLGDETGVGYLSASGMALILPYLLLSGYAGGIADRYNKRSVLIATKVLEVALSCAVLAALLDGRIELLIATLFLLGAQAVFFSPAKYGILPELLAPADLARANGLLEFGRYVAIICGTVLGGGLMSRWGGEPLALGAVAVTLALVGWLASLGIGRIAFDGVSRPIALNPWGDLWAETRRIAAHRRLRPLVLATTGFDFAVTLLLLAILLFARETMALDALGVGLLAGAAGIGVGLGAALVGRLSGRRIELAFVPVGALGAGAMVLLLGLTGGAVAATVACVVLAAASAGFILVPLYASLQRRAAQGQRGQIIATNNFLNMAGVLAASLAIWLLHDALGVTPAETFVGGGLALMTATALGLSCARFTRLRMVAILAGWMPRWLGGRRRGSRNRGRARVG